MVAMCGEQFYEQDLRATMLSKVIGFYPKICPAIRLTKLNMFLGTNFSAL